MIFSGFGEMKDGGNEYDERKGKLGLQHCEQLSLYHPKRKHLSDEVDSWSSGEVKKQKTDEKGGGGGGGDGASIEVARRPRGRPLGSKNKPKLPVIITREAEPSSAMRLHVLEIPGGLDVADALARFSARHNLGISVLACSGSVANVTLRQPSGAHAAREGGTIGFRGRLEILSVSATFLPPSLAALSAASSLSVSLAGPQGQVVGGTVVGPLVAAGTVVAVVAAFSSPTFHRLTAEDDASASVSASVSGGGGDAEASGQPEHDQDHDPHLHHQQQQYYHADQKKTQQYYHHDHHLQAPPAPRTHGEMAAVESCGMSLYSCHLPSDVVWAPTARPPPY